jgi:hypothetical protein
MFNFVKRWAKSILIIILGAYAGLTFVNIVAVHKGELIIQKGNIARTRDFSHPPLVINQEDQKFLDDLFQRQNQENTFAQYAAKAESNSKPVPRAESIAGTSEVKRAQLVVKGKW